MINTRDDMGDAKPPFTTVACVPVLGRLPLVKHTISRLLQKNGVDFVICAGHNREDRKVCEDAGAHWVQVDNHPLGRKWNSAFVAAKKFNPDACLFIGSSDWISDKWIPSLQPLMEKYDLVGTRGCHFIHIGEPNKLVYWPGYHNHRKGESIGLGRMISKRVLDQIHWKPFNDDINSSLDGSMQARCRSVAGNILTLDSPNIQSLSISTDLWTNLHNFRHHFSNMLPSQKIDNVDEFVNKHFPEINILCESLKGTSVSR